MSNAREDRDSSAWTGDLRRGNAPNGRFILAGWLVLLAGAMAVSPPDSSQGGTGENATAPTDPPATGSEHGPALYVREYRVEGAHHLTAIEVETAVYPFLGPGRNAEDVEQARASLEKAFKDKGYQTVAVEIPPQEARRGIVVLQVVENKVGRLRVRGARYFLPSQIKRRMPSLAEGRVPNFNDVTRDSIALNQQDLSIVKLVPQTGVEPGTMDIDIEVKDTLPLHGSIELNNRYSPDTTPLRLNGAISYNNLWQRGHSIGFNFQVAPERPKDATVYSGYYIARVPGVNWLSLMLQGTKQDSDVSTLGGAAVAGRGEVIGARAIIALPSEQGFYQSLSVGMDYKNFDEDVVLGVDSVKTPIEYYPLSASYGATWTGRNWFTELNGGVNFHLRGVGSDSAEFDAKRFRADGSYIYFRGDLSHTHDLPGGFQVFAKVQGQAGSQPLLNSEQFAGGGLATARGYLESTQLGDNAIFGTLELRSPSLLGRSSRKATDQDDMPAEKQTSEWRFYVFCDAGRLTLNDPLPDQADRFDLVSVGFGSRIQLWNHLSGSLDAGFPLVKQGTSEVNDLLVTFRLGLDF